MTISHLGVAVKSVRHCHWSISAVTGSDVIRNIQLPNILFLVTRQRLKVENRNAATAAASNLVEKDQVFDNFRISCKRKKYRIIISRFDLQALRKR